MIRVTTLASSGPGSLQEAAAASGSRTVVFAVGGVIRGDVAIKHSHITIAGQTAPSPGITLEGRLVARPEPWRRLQDIVVRFLRIRTPPGHGDQGDAVQLPDTERVMLDHLSLSWATDETVDVIHSSEVTLQWSTLEESDPSGHTSGRRHNFGLISAYPGSGNISIHHNLFAHHSRRSPSLSPYVKGKPGDFRNNVVYDFAEGLAHDGHVPQEAINLIGNYYRRGPSAWRIAPFVLHPQGVYCIGGNYVEGIGYLDQVRSLRRRVPAWLRLPREGALALRPAPVASVETHTAADALALVLAQAGAFPRDRITQRTVRETERGEGTWRRNAPPAPGDDWYLAGLPKETAAMDSDGDGMPDAWEDAQGLHKRDPTDHTRPLANGYSAIETYMNERAAALAPDRRPVNTVGDHSRCEDLLQPSDTRQSRPSTSLGVASSHAPAPRHGPTTLEAYEVRTRAGLTTP